MELSKEKNINLASLSTIQKILLLQHYLKEMTSIKERFIGNKNKMLEKLDSNCYAYYKNKIYMKKIFDYCGAHKYKPEENKNYQLKENPKLYLKELYKPLHDFYFLIRNDNSLMLKIIELSDILIYEELSDFFVNNLYENIIKSSFEYDELMLMIYLLLEKLIIEKFPDNIDKNKDVPIYYINNSFIYYAIKALTRKIDLRNFLFTTLNDFFVRIESFTIPLSVDINIVNRYVKIKDRKKHLSFMRNINSLTEEEIKRNKKEFKKMNKKDNLFNPNPSGNMYLKRTKRIVLGKSIVKFGDDSSNDNYNENGNLISLEEKLTQTHTLIDDSISNKPKLSQDINNDKNYKKFEKRKTEKKEDKKDNDNKEEKIFEEINLGINITKNKSEQDNTTNLNLPKGNFINITKNKSDNKGKDDIENQLDENNQIKIDIFFEDSCITIKKLKEYLSKYEKNKDNDKMRINLAMKEYLNILINQKFQEGNKDKNKEDKEIFSTSIIVEKLKEDRKIKQSDSFIGLMRRIRFNHTIITGIISEIINKLKDNLISSPYYIKCIAKMIEILLNKKYNILAKNKLSNYQLFMFEISFIIGNIILPILKKPEYNGMETTNVISDVASENLKLLSNILDKMGTGNLFNKNNEPYMTIFNKFIIETMPQLFELVEYIEKHFELPAKIKKLIYAYDKQKIINYDYFKENPEETINYQSICFSWKNVYILLQIIDKYKNIFIDENNNKEQKLILQKFLDHKDKYIIYFTQGLKDKKLDYFYITKDLYQEKFDKKIKSIIQDNFIYVIPKPTNDIITAFKKCIIEVLNYANKIQKESFYELTEMKDIKTIPKRSKKSKKEEEKKINSDNNIIINNQINKKNSLANRLRNSLVKIALTNKDEDADFRDVLFPQIRKNINFEINYNVDNNEVQRIIFCTNYIHLYMRNIPSIYKKNNYSLVFSELIIETKSNIEYLKTNALLEYYKKLKEAEKLNMMNSSYQNQIQNLEKLKCIEYLYNKLLLSINFNIEKDPRNIISNIEYQINQNKNNNNNQNIDVIDYFSRQNQPIQNMIDSFQDFHIYEEEYDNILDIEEKTEVPEALNDYFKEMKHLIKKEKIIQRFNKDELEKIIYDLENYILTKMYDKLFPFEYTKKDVFFYKKCKRLGFIKPENFIDNKKIINENLWNQALKYFDYLDDKITPIDKIRNLANALEILQNSINFTSGKDELGVDDIIKPLAYIVIKAKPRNIYSNQQYCELYLNSELSKRGYGVILSQLNLVINIIENMKYNDLIGVSEEQFGKDDENENDDEN